MMRGLSFLCSVVPWLLLLGFAWTVIAPASLWMSVRAVRVADAPHGVSPSMMVDRSIHWDFAADWIATVRRIDNEAATVIACVGSGRSDYRTTSRLPADLTLDWWMTKHCNLDAGQYVLTTRWKIDVRTPWDKTLDAPVSNVFTIYAR